MKQLSILCLSLLLGVALAACGGSAGTRESSRVGLSPEAAEVLSAARAYYRTLLDRDISAQCSLMSVRGRAETADMGAGRSCAGTLRELERTITPKKEAGVRKVWDELNSSAVTVSVRGSRASVKVPEERMTFEREGGRWLLRGSFPRNWRELLVFSSYAAARELKALLEREQERPVKRVICLPTSAEKVGSRFDCVVEFRSGLRALLTSEVSRSLEMEVIRLQALPGEHWKEEFGPKPPASS